MQGTWLERVEGMKPKCSGCRCAKGAAYRQEAARTAVGRYLRNTGQIHPYVVVFVHSSRAPPGCSLVAPVCVREHGVTSRSVPRVGWILHPGQTHSVIPFCTGSLHTWTIFPMASRGMALSTFHLLPWLGMCGKTSASSCRGCASVKRALNLWKESRGAGK